MVPKNPTMLTLGFALSNKIQKKNVQLKQAWDEEREDTRAKHTIEIEEKDSKCKKLVVRIEKLVDMTTRLVSCKPLARVFALYLHEKFLCF